MSCSRRVGCWSFKGCCGCWWFREDWSLRIFTLKVWAEWLNVPIIQLKWINMCSKGQTGMQWFVVCLWSENRETVGRDLWWSQEVPHGAWNLDLWEHARLPAEGNQQVVLLLSCVCFLLFDVFLGLKLWNSQLLYCRCFLLRLSICHTGQGHLCKNIRAFPNSLHSKFASQSARGAAHGPPGCLQLAAALCSRWS